MRFKPKKFIVDVICGLFCLFTNRGGRSEVLWLVCETIVVLAFSPMFLEGPKPGDGMRLNIGVRLLLLGLAY